MNNLPDCHNSAFYIFDDAAAAERITQIRKALGAPVKIAYAVKANPFLTNGLIGVADRFEICSPGEALICRQAGVPLDVSVISGVYKTPADIEDSVSRFSGQIFTVESQSQFSLLAKLAEKYNQTLPILLRLTNGSQFGLDEEDLIDLVNCRNDFPMLEFRGVQFFSGTQKTSLKKLQREIAELEALMNRLRTQCGWCPRELEYGPGFPAACFRDEKEPEELIHAFGEAIAPMTKLFDITLELGRSIAACAGKYYTHVVDIKRCKGQNYALSDGGMHQLVYYGQFMGMKHPPVTIVGKEKQKAQEAWNVCGAICSMNDIIVKQIQLPSPRIGDVLCFENAGAYCVTEGAALFLSRELPAVYVCRRDGTVVCARPTTPIHAWNTFS